MSRTLTDGGARRASVTITPRSLWRLRLTREFTRYLLHAVAVAGLLASARFAIAPPRPAAGAPPRGQVSRDLAAEWFASQFARRYLAWDAGDPEARERALAQFVTGSAGPDAGLQPPEGDGRPRAGLVQRVLWTQVVQEREPELYTHVYIVAAQTDSQGLLYLAVSVRRRSDGSLCLGGYPAFVGAPASNAATSLEAAASREVTAPELKLVVRRALRNYLIGARSDLQADMTPDARVSPPRFALALQSLQQLAWADGHGSVSAVVRARDTGGTQYTLTYELDVVHQQGRWEIAAIEMNPDS